MKRYVLSWWCKEAVTVVERPRLWGFLWRVTRLRVEDRWVRKVVADVKPDEAAVLQAWFSGEHPLDLRVVQLFMGREPRVQLEQGSFGEPENSYVSTGSLEGPPFAGMRRVFNDPMRSD